MLDSDSHPNKASSSLDAERSNLQPSFVTLTCEASPCHVQRVRQVADDAQPSCTGAGINLAEENSRAD